VKEPNKWKTTDSCLKKQLQLKKSLPHQAVDKLAKIQVMPLLVIQVLKKYFIDGDWRFHELRIDLFDPWACVLY
jgi:hypothetical protein